MAEANVRVALDGLGKKIRTEEVTVGPDLVEQQVITIADALGNLIAILNSLPTGTEYGLVVREAQQGQKTMAQSRPVTIASDQSALGVNTPPLFGSDVFGGGVYGALPITNATLVAELFRTRFALQVLLAQFGISIDLTALKGTEGI